MNNTTTITPPSLPESKVIKDIETCNVCLFDVKTTCLLDDSEIVQVSAVDWLTQSRCLSSSSGKLFCDGELTEAAEMNATLNRFELSLKKFCGTVVLVGHEAWAFDVKHFWNNVKNWHLEDLFPSCLEGFVNTFPLFRDFFPEKYSHSPKTL